MKKTAIALAIALGTMSGTASALTINQLTAANPSFQLEDDSVESINVDANGDKKLQVGDTLRGVAEFPQLKNLVTNATISLGNGTNSHLSAIFEAEATARTFKFTQAGQDFYDYTFGANAAFGTSIGYTGAVIAFYEAPTDNVDIFACGTVGPSGTCEDSVTDDGTLILVLGFAGDPDEFWNSTNTPELTTLPTGSQTTESLGNFNFGLSVLYSAIGEYSDSRAIPFLAPTNGDFLGNDKVQWTGSGQVLGTLNGTTPVTLYSATDDTDLAANRIPEPATLGLLGLGLVGLAGLRRRKSA